MRNLVKLELKRVSLKSHFIGLLAANIVIVLLSGFTSSLLNAGGGVAVTGLPPAQLDTLTLATMLVRATLIVWEAVLISVFIVEEYRNKTINLLFTYPVQRGKLIAVKIILICGVMLLFHALSGVFQFTCLSVASKYFPFVTVSPANLITQAVTALSAVLLGLLPLYVGMIKKSTIATIVSSFAIAAVVSNSQGSGAGLMSIPIAAIVFGVIGAGFSAIIVHKMVSSDLSN